METILEKEYLVPWLSVLPDQENVKLKLKVDIKYGEPTDLDVIKLPSKEGITFIPDSIKVSDVSTTEILITCENPIDKDVKCEILDKNENKIGFLNLCKNDEVLEVPIRIIKVLEDDESSNINERVFDQTTEHYDTRLDEIRSYIINKGLNQVFVKPILENESFERLKTLRVNFRELEEMRLVTYNGPTSTQPNFFNETKKRKELAGFLNLKLENEYGVFKGVTIFLTIINSKKLGESAFSWVTPRSINTVMIPNGLFDEKTFLHEISHSLGLEHTFEKTEDKESNIEVYKNNIEKFKRTLTKHENKQETDIINYSDGTSRSVKEERDRCDRIIKENEIKLIDAQETVNKFIFEEASTDNIMDYPKGILNGRENTNAIKNAFYKYQQSVIHEDIKNLLR